MCIWLLFGFLFCLPFATTGVWPSVQKDNYVIYILCMRVYSTNICSNTHLVVNRDWFLSPVVSIIPTIFLFPWLSDYSWVSFEWPVENTVVVADPDGERGEFRATGISPHPCKNLPKREDRSSFQRGHIDFMVVGTPSLPIPQPRFWIRCCTETHFPDENIFSWCYEQLPCWNVLNLFRVFSTCTHLEKKIH